MATFDRALGFTLRWEGGKSDHPSDRGGRTNYGITQRVYSPDGTRDVWNMTLDEAGAIYREHYYLNAQCDKIEPLSERLAVAHFDSAVQHGLGRAAKFLQAAVGAKPDGLIGGKTWAALGEALHTRGETAVVGAYLARRRAFYEAIVAHDPTQKVFLKGWTNRLNALADEVAQA